MTSMAGFSMCKSDDPLASGLPCGVWGLMHSVLAEIAELHKCTMAHAECLGSSSSFFDMVLNQRPQKPVGYPHLPYERVGYHPIFRRTHVFCSLVALVLTCFFRLSSQVPCSSSQESRQLYRTSREHDSRRSTEIHERGRAESGEESLTLHARRMCRVAGISKKVTKHSGTF